MNVTSDSFANHVVELHASNVDEWIEFDAWALVGCHGSSGIIELSPASFDQRHLLAFTPLTEADDMLAERGRLHGQRKLLIPDQKR